MRFDLSTPLDVERFRLFGKKLIDSQVMIDVTPHSNKRTLKQNSLYWMWLACIEDETGNDKNFLHDYFVKRFMVTEEIDAFGDVIDFAKSLRLSDAEVKRTSTRSTKQFTNYLDQIQMFAIRELNISLPIPEDKDYDGFLFTYE